MSGAEERKFVMKQVFKDIMKMNPGDEKHGIEVKYYNIPWKIKLRCLDSTVFLAKYDVLIDCLEKRKTHDWSIKAKFVTSHGGKMKSTIKIHTFSNKSDQFHNLICDTIFDASIDSYDPSKLEVECHVTILEIIGIKTEKLRNFDNELAMKYSDVVLKVEGQKFYVNKMFLAVHSTYFECLLLGNFEESKKSEVELININPEDFQNYLELIYGDSSVEGCTVQGILQLADFFDSKSAIRRCEKFLVEKSILPLKEKFHVAIRYKLDELRRKCISEMKTVDDVMSVIPEDSSQLNHTVWKELLLKRHSVGENK